MAKQSSSTKYIDYLKEDKPIPGQLWVCMSFLSPEGIKNCSVRGLKIRGVFGTRQEADERANELQKIDSDFHVFVGEVGKWLPWDPDPNDVADQVYQEKELNDLMKGYKENLEKSKKMQQDRKEDMIRQAAKEEQSREGKTRDRLRKNLEANKNKKKLDQLAKKSLEKEEEDIQETKQKLQEQDKELTSSVNNLESIDEKLAKIQDLYKKMKK